jgi:hypothetical protein
VFAALVRLSGYRLLEAVFIPLAAPYANCIQKHKGGRQRGVGRFFIASLHLYRFEQRGLVKNSEKKNEWRLTSKGAEHSGKEWIWI